MKAAGGVIALSCGDSDRFRLSGCWRTQIVFSFCQTKTLWTIAPPQNTIPTPISALVTIAGVDWNWVNVYKMIPKIKRTKIKQ